MIGWTIPHPQAHHDHGPQPPVGTVAMYLGDVAAVTHEANPAWDCCRNNDARPAPVEPPGDTLHSRTGAAGGDAGGVLLEAQGWMVCDGRPLCVSEAPHLHAVLGTRYGHDGAGTFRLPDLRGVFLRGVDAGAGVDPDIDLRYAPDGTLDAGVGSLQCDALRTHVHTYTAPVSGGTASSGSGVLSATTTTDTGEPIDTRASTETRPRNVAVYYIIRYR